MRLTTALLAAALVSSGLIVALRVGLPGPVAAEARVPGSPCVEVSTTSRKDPVLLLGETTEITMHTSVLCAGMSDPVHVVLVLDGSSRMAGRPLQSMRSAAEKAVEGLSLKDRPDFRVGVVEFNDEPRQLIGLSNSEERVVRAIRRVEARGSAAIDEGLLEGLALLRRGRSEVWPPGLVPGELLLLFSNGNNATGCLDALRAASQVKNIGALVKSICVGPDCDSGCMRRIASTSRYFLYVEDLADILRHVFPRHPGFRVEVEELTITEHLSDNVALVDGSDIPTATRMADGRVVWRFGAIPRDGVTVTYSIAPTGLGDQPTTLGATGRFTDSVGLSKSFEFEVPQVTVLRPRVIATPDPRSVP